MIDFVEGDLFEFIKTKKNVFVPHVANCYGKMGSGFVVPLAQHFPKAKEEYLKLNEYLLGTTQFVEVQENPRVVICNMIAQTLGGERPLFYNKLVNSMDEVANKILFEYEIEGNLNDIEIVAPLFGSGLAGGNFNFIQELIKDCWTKKGIPVTICYLKNFLPNNWSPPNV